MKTRTILAIIALGAILAAAFMAIMTPARASADDTSYFTMLANAGYSGPAYKWLGTGNAVCGATVRGVSDYDIASWIVETTGSGIYRDEAYEIITIARSELCPAAFAYAA